MMRSLDPVIELHPEQEIESLNVVVAASDGTPPMS